MSGLRTEQPRADDLVASSDSPPGRVGELIQRVLVPGGQRGVAVGVSAEQRSRPAPLVRPSR